MSAIVDTLQAGDVAGRPRAAAGDTLGKPEGLIDLDSILAGSRYPTIESFLDSIDAHEGFRFPSADELAAAAAAFPAPELGPFRSAWHRRDDTTHAEYSGDIRPGSWPQLELGPGIVRLRYVDHERRAAAAERAAERRRAEVDAVVARERYLLHAPMALVDEATLLRSLGREDDQKVRQVAAWSAKSQRNLMATIGELDLCSMVSGDRVPAMITLTLPGDWLAVAPDAATAAKAFDRFVRAWEDKWGPLSCIWKREFQDRWQAPRTVAGLDSGRAPHWHIWTVPPVDAGGMMAFKRWVSMAWTRALKVDPTLGPDHDSTRDRCKCSEWCRSLGAGTGVDVAEGMRARDPKRLAFYFLKESGNSAAKSYQNTPPPEWAGQSVGRYWGVRKINRAVYTVQLDPRVAPGVARRLRSVRSSKTIAKRRPVVRVSIATGELRTRFVSRPARQLGRSGWVAANDGARLAAQLAAYVGGPVTIREDRPPAQGSRRAELRARYRP